MAKTFVTTYIFLLHLITIFPLSNSQFNAVESIFPPSNGRYNVIDYGASPDGKGDSAQAFLKTWSAACASAKPSTFYVPHGTFLIENIVFQGLCRAKVVFQIEGNMVAPTNFWKTAKYECWIYFRIVHGVFIIGKGTIDGKGAGLWNCKRHRKRCPAGTKSICFSSCNNVWINGLTSINSQNMHMSIDHCNNFDIRHVTIRAPGDSPNTDGIQMKGSRGVTISSSDFLTGDDCIAISQGCKNIWIEHINCGPGHGVSIGSLGDAVIEEGVENVTVINSVFTKTQNGVRIKAWSKQSNGFARKIVYQNLIMRSAFNPVIIDQNYCPSGRCHGQISGVNINDVLYKNITGISATQIALNFICSARKPCRQIRLEDINLRVRGKRALSFCKYVQGSSFRVISPKSCI